MCLCDFGEAENESDSNAYKWITRWELKYKEEDFKAIRLLIHIYGEKGFYIFWFQY